MPRRPTTQHNLFHHVVRILQVANNGRYRGSLEDNPTMRPGNPTDLDHDGQRSAFRNVDPIQNHLQQVIFICQKPPDYLYMDVPEPNSTSFEDATVIIEMAVAMLQMASLALYSVDPDLEAEWYGMDDAGRQPWFQREQKLFDELLFELKAGFVTIPKHAKSKNTGL